MADKLSFNCFVRRGFDQVQDDLSVIQVPITGQRHNFHKFVESVGLNGTRQTIRQWNALWYMFAAEQDWASETETRLAALELDVAI